MNKVYTIIIACVLSGVAQNTLAQVKKATTTTKKSTTVKKTTVKPAVKKPVKQAPKPALSTEPPMNTTVKPTPPPPPPLPPVPEENASKSLKPIFFEAGITLAKSIRGLNRTNAVGIGIDAAAHYNLPGKLKDAAIGLRFNYAYFTPRSTPAYYVNSKFPSAHILSIMVDGEYKLPMHIVVGGDLGYGYALRSTFNQGGLAASLYGGYQIDLGKNPCLFSLYFAQAMQGTKNIGLRAALLF